MICPLDKAGPFLQMLLNRPNLGTEMEVIINDRKKKPKPSIGRSLIQLWMDPYIKFLRLGWNRDDSILPKSRGKRYSISDEYKKDLDYERAYHVEELHFRGYDRKQRGNYLFTHRIKKEPSGKPKV